MHLRFPLHLPLCFRLRSWLYKLIIDFYQTSRPLAISFYQSILRSSSASSDSVTASFSDSSTEWFLFLNDLSFFDE